VTAVFQARFRRAASLAVPVLALFDCRPQKPWFAPPEESPAQCSDRTRDLSAFVAALPERSVAAPAQVQLAMSTLGGVPGTGSVLEVGKSSARLDDRALAEGGDLEARVKALRERAASQGVLYVAAAADVEVRTLRAYFAAIPEAVELRLLVRSPPPSAAGLPGEGSEEARQLAAKVLLEPDATARRELAEQGYDHLADCPPLQAAVASVARLEGPQRWPALKAALATALPQCDCRKLDTAGLRWLVSAEQRAGAAALAWLPLSFLRDERCDASMPLRSMQKLVSQMEAFDAEFAGGWQKDALRFDQVLNDERLGVQFCDALPGETLAAKQRSRATLYLRVTGGDGCTAIRFEPREPGSPLGVLRSTAAFYYSQAAEEIRIFGPMAPQASKSPDPDGSFPCDETFRLVGVNKDSIELEQGRLFFNGDACQRAPAAPLRAGCVATGLAGAPAQ
jgi:hypothetical protein